MTDVYARDAQARDLRLMDKLISEIRSGSFCPDESRAGRFHESKRLKPSDNVPDGGDHVDEGDGAEDDHETRFGSDTCSPNPITLPLKTLLLKKAMLQQTRHPQVTVQKNVR